MTGIANTKSVSQSVISLCSTTQKISLGLTARDKAGSDPHIVGGPRSRSSADTANQTPDSGDSGTGDQ